MSTRWRALIRLTAVGLSLAGLALAAPDKPEVRMTVNKTTLLPSETLNVTIFIKGFDLPAILPPKWPKIAGLIQVDDSSSTLPSRVGGRTYVLHRFSCSYIPVESGLVDFPAINVQMPDFQFRSKPIQIKVLNPDGSENDQPLTSRAAAEQPEESTAGAEAQAPPESMIIEAVASNLKPFQGEQVLLTYRIVTRRGLMRQAKQLKRPDFAHFWTESPELPPGHQVDSFVHKGTQYYRIILERLVLFPQKAGRLEIKPATWEITSIPVPEESDPAPPIALSTTPLTLDVQPLPARPGTVGRIEVGNFQMSLNYNSNLVKLGQAFPLYLTMKGRGNIRGLLPPELPLDDRAMELVSIQPVHAEFHRLPGGAGDDPASHYGGEKVWQMLVYPKRLGTVEVAPIEFTFFDPVRQAYETVRTRAVKLIVDSVDEKTGLSGASPPRIRHDLSNWLPLLIVLGLVLILAGTLLYLFLTHKPRFATKALKRRASSAESLLREAEEMVSHRGAESFYDLLAGAIVMSIQQYLEKSPGAMNREELLDVLVRRNVDPGLVQTVFTVWTHCDEARFAGQKFEVAQRAGMLEPVKNFHSALKERKFSRGD